MFWEDLTAGDFVRTRETTQGTCLLPLGVIEKHGGHLPLGTDMFTARHLAGKIAAAEPVVVFPYYFFGPISEANHCPGTIAVKPELMYDLFTEICGIISANGFKKIAILDCHGTNELFLKYYIQSSLYSRRDYVIYHLRARYSADIRARLEEMLGTDDFGQHAGNTETSTIMSVRPDLVKLEQSEPEGFPSWGRLENIKNDAFTPMFWYADHPTHQAGHISAARAEVGDFMTDYKVSQIAKILREIKADTVTPALLEEFYTKSETKGG